MLDPLEVGPGVRGLLVESTTSEHLLAPFRNLNSEQASQQSEIGWRCAAAVIGAVGTAMMNDDHRAAEGFAYGICRVQVSRHVLVTRFRTGQAPVEGIKRDRHGVRRTNLCPDGSDEPSMVLHQVHAQWHEIEWDFSIWLDAMVLAECRRAGLETIGAFEGAIDRRTRDH